MVDILHKVGIQSSSLESTYRALATLPGLASWWTSDTTGSAEIGGVIRFGFGAGKIEMKVLDSIPSEHVVWQVVDGPSEWIGTTIQWSIRKGEAGWTTVVFKHRGWKEPVDFMHHCSTKWAVFLLSLKSLLETGKGSPAPNDLKLDHWE